ncbi:probable G-protein coupled receptor 34 [Megalops cyprinoides]|uniref:probable G-protein coupled receptor 34 n=1 Tax=Megalops cyprinoides TaxID=118141 RepID=UPI001863AFAC|nr:probable G-protein coupled receptor 34 [Megalops cyprinoides]
MTSPYSTVFSNESHTSGTTEAGTQRPHPTVNGSQCQLDDSALSVPLAFCYSLFFLFGLAGNLFALWVFLFVHAKKNSVRVFLINVAVADLLLVACLPFRVLYHAGGNRWPLGHTLCKVVGNVFYMNMYISITLLGLISVDRYVKIRRPACSRWLQPQGWSVAACCVVWLASIVGTVPMITISYDDGEPHRCFHYKRRQGAEWMAYFNGFLVALFWAVFLALVVSYGRIALELLETSRAKPDLPNAVKYSRTAKKSFFVLFLFTVCFVPYHASRCFYIHSQISEVSCHWRNVLDRANEVVLLLSTFNSCLDPVMYFLLSGSVRKATLRVVSDLFHPRGGGSDDSPRPSVVPGVSTSRASSSMITPLRVNLAALSKQ